MYSREHFVANGALEAGLVPTALLGNDLFHLENLLATHGADAGDLNRLLEGKRGVLATIGRNHQETESMAKYYRTRYILLLKYSK